MKLSTVQTAFSLGLLLLAVPAIADTPDHQINRLEGIVVSSTDGRPLPGIQVVMAHEANGELQIEPLGSLNGTGAKYDHSRDFALRNAKFFCDTFTDDQGLFTLTSFAAPEERWTLAAGDYEHGICLRNGVVPADYAEQPLRIEIDPPAFITVNRLPNPPDASFRASVELAIVNTPTGGPATLGNNDADHAPQTNVEILSWPEKADDPVWRLGPLPPNYTYRVTHSLWSPKLRYDVTLFERQVLLRPGAIEFVSLEAEPGTTIKGRLTDTKNQPLSDVNVLVRTQGEAGIVLGTLSDADGGYVLNNVPAGTHLLELLRHAKPTAPI